MKYPCSVAASPRPLWLCVLVCPWFIAFGAHSFAAEDEDDEPQLLPGLVARYATDGIECARRDDAVQFVWNDRSPDERLPPADSFSAGWRGQLLVLAPGKHRFHVYAAGEVSLEVDGQKLVRGSSQNPRWFDSPAIDLDFGHHPIAIGFRRTSDQARVGLYWSGPQFEAEPVPGRLLLHEPSDRPDDRFERGAELWHALRCGNCHPQIAGPAGLPGPSLTGLSGNISRAWLVDWLRIGNRPADDDSGASARRMPYFDLDDRDARAAAEYLLGAKMAERSAGVAAGDPARGQRLFFTLGCLACHQVGDLGTAGLFGGGDLAHVANKRPADFFARWLADPAKINPAHRMPVFRVSQKERSDLSAWLATLCGPAERSNDEDHKSADSDRGRTVVESLRCQACHALPGVKPAPVSIAIREDWADRQTCFDRPDLKNGGRPGYRLSPAQREAITAYLAAAQWGPRVRDDGRFVLRERNCLGCHARDGDEGIASRLSKVVERQPDLAPLLPTLTPPALTAIGDKLHDEALADAISLRHPPLRPWLAVRMPRFDLSPDELATLTSHFAAIDRIPDRPHSETKVDPKGLTAAGGRLVTSAGFGCTSCHNIGT
jgi:cytochrome c2